MGDNPRDVTTPDNRQPPGPVTLLRHCRCCDCRKFRRDVRGECFCADGIGGTGIVWATGERVCDPPPELWHYCAGYDGPPISRDVWAWRRPVPPGNAAG